MNILILGGHHLNTMAYHEWIPYADHNLFIFMDQGEAKETCSDVSQANWDKYKIVKQYENYFTNGQVELDVIELHKKHKLDYIISFRELEILRAARLRDYLGLKGQSYDSALAFRDKVRMKELALKGGLRTPAFSPIRMATDLHHFIDIHGYPVFVKPISAAGSVKAKAIRSENELRNFVQQDLAGDIHGNGYTQSYHVEEYIDGEFFNVDGAVLNGELILCSPGRYNAHADLETIKRNGYWSSTMFDRDSCVRKKLATFIAKLLKVLPTPENTVFHSEVFITKEGDVTLCEIASRPPGGGMWSALNAAYDIDMLKLAVTLQWNPGLIDSEDVKIKNASVPNLTGSVFIPPKEGIFRSAASECPLDGVVKYELMAKENENYSGGKGSCDGVAMFVICGNSDQELQSIVRNCVDWFWKISRWDNA